MKIFFTPGPSQRYPTLAQHIQSALELNVPEISHRSQFFKDYFAFTVRELKKLMGIPDDFSILFHTSATEIWERLLQNCVVKHSQHYVNGSFSERFFKAAGSLQLEAIAGQAKWGSGFHFDATSVPQEMEMINFTHNETSTGFMLPLEKIYPFRSTHPNALLTLDMVSSAPYGNPDWNKIDAAYFSVQKSFGLPAGLGVLIAGPRIFEKALEKEAKGKSIGTYRNFLKMRDKFLVHQTLETPNMLGIYLLGKVCADMNATGIDKIREKTEEKYEKLVTFIEKQPSFEFFVKDPAIRSKTVIIVDFPEGAQAMIQYLDKKGLVVGNGYGPFKGKQIRVANFPAITTENMDQLIAAMADFSKA